MDRLIVDRLQQSKLEPEEIEDRILRSRVAASLADNISRVLIALMQDEMSLLPQHLQYVNIEAKTNPHQPSRPIVNVYKTDIEPEAIAAAAALWHLGASTHHAPALRRMLVRDAGSRAGVEDKILSYVPGGLEFELLEPLYRETIIDSLPHSLAGIITEYAVDTTDATGFIGWEKKKQNGLRTISSPTDEIKGAMERRYNAIVHYGHIIQTALGVEEMSNNPVQLKENIELELVVPSGTFERDLSLYRHHPLELKPAA